MRIISGTAKGIPLVVPKGEVRPTTDRVREALFSILGERIIDANVLDLFAGSGALGIESLSRGARSVQFVDMNRASCEAVRKNLDKARLASRARIAQADALGYVQRESRSALRYDIIFADPPYCKSATDKDFLLAMMEGSLDALLSDDGLFIGEAEAGWGITRPGFEFPQPWQLVTQRSYGKNALLFFRKDIRA